jgi:hypothetical protein
VVFAKFGWYKDDGKLNPFLAGAQSGSVVKTERKTEQAGLLHPVRQRALLAVEVWFAKTLADVEINDIAALPPLFCYNS